MRRFVFSLQKVLDYRQRLEEQAIRAFAEAQAELAHQQHRLRHLLDWRQECLNRSERRHRLAVALLDIEQTFLSALEEQIQLQRQRVAEAQHQVEVRRQQLIEAQRERKTLERLKEKQYEQWRLELLRWEQKQIDDLASMRAATSPGWLHLVDSGGETNE